MAKQEIMEVIPEVPGIDFSKVPLPSGNWVKLGGAIKMKAIWEIRKAPDNEGDMVLARHMGEIIEDWSFELDKNDPDSIGELEFPDFVALSNAAGSYIEKQADVGNSKKTST
jgi:hypothetical protein